MPKNSKDITFFFTHEKCRICVLIGHAEVVTCFDFYRQRWTALKVKNKQSLFSLIADIAIS